MFLILVRETWSHMESVSGFDPLFSTISVNQSIRTISYHVNEYSNSFNTSRLKRLFSKTKTINIKQAVSPFVELKHERVAQLVINCMREHPSALVLLSVTENQFAPSFASLSDAELARLVLFVHQPPSWFRLFWKDMGLFSKVKAVVCLCQEQQDFFKLNNSAPIICIKHGVNLNFFKPLDIEKKASKKLLFVGQWMRDFDTLYKVFEKLSKIDTGLSLHCVVQRRFRNHPSLYLLAQLPNVYWYDHIRADELRTLYQYADLLLLPLIDSTANNAFVEAAACGLPVVSNYVGGASEYVANAGARLVARGNELDMVNACLELLTTVPKESNLTAEIRLFAEKNLSWEAQADAIVRELKRLI